VDKGWHHFEEIQRIPLILRGPERYVGPAARVCAEWASLTDLYATILDLAGADASAEQTHGGSLLPAIRGEELRERTALVEFMGVNNLAATMFTCRHGNLKYGWNCGCEDELYDLEADPLETRDLVDDPAYRDALRKMRERMEGMLEHSGYGGMLMYRQCALGVNPYWVGPRTSD
jgi:arylsulfatase A-like enzyme